jgi:large subunit ribosomal protein L18e
MSKINRPAMSLARLLRKMKGERADKIAVIVGTITNDQRIFDVPKIKVLTMIMLMLSPI